ncbi:MAG: cupin domain-containing protein [Planctomycetota bacterium]|nr:cupin domain-containing protein [Planctomycetota bacterium]
MDPEELIRRLDLVPHPEGGCFRETWRDRPPGGGRGSGTAIYYLLRAGERSRRHRIDAAEVWHHYAGGPLELTIEDTVHVLGPDLAAGERPQLLVPPGAWQAARPLGPWTLAGCTVSPAFEFDFFEFDPDDPPDRPRGDPG